MRGTPGAPTVAGAMRGTPTGPAGIRGRRTGAVEILVETFDIEAFSDFSAK